MGSIVFRSKLFFVLGHALLLCFVQSAKATDNDTLQISLSGVKTAEVSVNQVLAKQVYIRVNNPTSKTRVLSQILVTDFHLRKPDGSASSVKVSVSSKSNVEITPLESVTLPLSLDSLDPKQIHNILPMTYVGVIALTENDTGRTPATSHTIPLTVQLTVPGGHFAVSALAEWVHRDWPWLAVKNYHFRVPLTEESPAPIYPRRYVLTNDRGKLATATLLTPDANQPVNVLIFEIANLETAGKYQGQIDVGSGDGNGIVTNVNVKDLFLWPLLTMILGILVAQVTKQGVKYGMDSTDKKNVHLVSYLLKPSDRELFRSFLALLVALLTAFKSLYIGKAFGSPSDYIDIFLSGTTAKVSIDLLAFGAAQYFAARVKT